ncbi:hypothetical protein BV20DRAFT_150320 [Pilatotrama ljubarskyi]|nr:hypothetical protein BV20DRAFT_150320 [Pilatotrama ljubarskyi]
MSGKYIVVFKDHVSPSEVEKYANEVNANGGNVEQRYDNVLKGFSATIPESFLMRLQSFQGSVIDYIGESSLSPSQMASPFPPAPVSRSSRSTWSARLRQSSQARDRHTSAWGESLGRCGTFSRESEFSNVQR